MRYKSALFIWYIVVFLQVVTVQELQLSSQNPFPHNIHVKFRQLRAKKVHFFLNKTFSILCYLLYIVSEQHVQEAETKAEFEVAC